MRRILLAIALTMVLAPAAQAQDILDYYRDWQQQQQSVVEQHPKASEPVSIKEIPEQPLPPYLAQKYLRNEDYMQWALMWNAYQDEKANRASKTRVLFGRTTTTTNTTNGTVTNVVPRVWFQHQGAPGQIRYNPFVPPTPGQK